jgi:hypothetical protein
MARSFLPSRRQVVEGEPYFEDAEFGAAYPALYELLASSRGADGKGRLPASLSFFAEDGRLKACVNDRTTGMVWFVTLDGTRGLLEQVESCLQAERGSWRVKKAR